ncbi:response regulator [Sphingomonas sp.]|uniref:response regulator n=1 Tax=Sphingomonas sp. TaxID=28214 RepID=UPI0017A88EED|nr:response regulator [Sphingomonas sp.]MBA3512228.1 response regulator [Sphingomonas sp.]
MHALIIEDEVMIAAAIEFVLRDCGFDSFDVASSSMAAIRAAARRCPDLITADVALAAGDGIEAVRIICRGPSIPVIFITGQPAAEVRQQMSDYPVLTKPFSEQTLTYTIAASLDR